jgi:signal transduction histidine kinase
MPAAPSSGHEWIVPRRWGREFALVGAVAVALFALDMADTEPLLDFLGTATLLALVLGRIALLVRDNERQLRRTERLAARHRAVLSALEEAVMLQDETGRIIDCNPAAVRLLDREQLASSVHDIAPQLDLIHADGSPLLPSERPGRIVLTTGVPQRGTVVGANQPDGTVRWFEVSAVPLESGVASAGKSVVTSFRDVTQRLANAQRLADARAQAEEAAAAADEANRAKSEFLSRMSHELRTPLNAVLGFGQLLRMDDLTDNQNDSVLQIMTAGQHLLGLINEVLEISRIETGHVEMAMAPVPVREAVAAAVDLIRPSADASGIAVSIAPGCLDDARVDADRSRLVQVLVNVLSNAVKYNRPGGTIDIKGEMWIEPGRSRLRILVTDTGWGIAPELIDRVFLPFDRLGAERATIEGSGRGRSLSHALVEHLNGADVRKPAGSAGPQGQRDPPRP